MTTGRARPNAYRATKTGVVLTLTRAEFNTLLMLLGVAAANDSTHAISLRLVNRINTGNPDFVPYEEPKD